MSLSIVIPWRDRDELASTILPLLECASLTNGDVTIVNYSGDRNRLARQLPPDAGRLTVIEVRDQQYFHKAKCQNIGASASHEAVLFFCDCDVLVKPEEVAEISREVETSASIFATLAGVKETEINSRRAGNVVQFGYELNIRVANGRDLRIVDHEEDAHSGLRQAPGLLLVKRTDFMNVNGYNGRLHGWGWEDQDMIARLTLSGGLKRIQRGTALHISHDDEARTAAYPPVSSRWESRDKMFRQALAYYDDCDLSGTFLEDIQAIPH